MEKQALISGLTGFVGSNLSKYLREKGYDVTGISRSKGQVGTLNWNDVSDYSRQFSLWIHLAGKAHDVHGNSDAAGYDVINYGLTHRFFDAFCKSDGQVFIFLSSVKAAADKVPGMLHETDTANPQTPYGISKLKAEQYILQNLPEGKQVYILRPCVIHGPGNKGNLNLLFRLVEKGIPWPLAAFENKRSFLSVQNLCLVIEKLAEGIAPTGVYQVADDEPLSTNELIVLMAEVMGKKVRLWHFSPYFIRMVARLGDFINFPLNSSRLQKLTESYVVDNSKIKAALQISFPVDARSGLKRTIQSFKK